MQIHGKIIIGFPVGDNEIEQYSCDFYLREDSHDFIMEVEDYPIERLSIYCLAMKQYIEIIYSVLMKTMCILHFMIVLLCRCKFQSSK